MTQTQWTIRKIKWKSRVKTGEWRSEHEESKEEDTKKSSLRNFLDIGVLSQEDSFFLSNHKQAAPSSAPRASPSA